MKYKSRIEFTDTNNDIVEHEDYLKFVDELNDANLNFDIDSIEYHKTVSKFPEFFISEVIDEFTLELSRNILDMLFVEVSLQDNKFNFLLDTGAEVSCISSVCATKSNGIVFSEQEVNVGGAGGQFSQMQVCYAEKVKVSEIEIRNIPMLVLNEKQLSVNILGRNIANIDGVLGWDVLKNFDFIINYNMLEVKILPTKDKVGTGNFIKSIFPIVLVLDKKNIIRKFGVDIGARKSWLSDKLVEEERLNVLAYKKKLIYGVNGTSILNSSVVSKYTIDIASCRLIFNNISTGFTGLINNYELDGVLGVDILKDRKLVILNSESRLYFERMNER